MDSKEDIFLLYPAVSLDDCMRLFMKWETMIEMVSDNLEDYFLEIEVSKDNLLAVKCDIYGIDTRLGFVEKLLGCQP
jgi:hypothetical protein